MFFVFSIQRLHVLSTFAGESNIEQIQTNVHSAMGGNMSLFCLGFGNDVEYSFLDVMSKQNKGMARRIYEGSDAAVQLQVWIKIKLNNDNVHARLGIFVIYIPKQ